MSSIFSKIINLASQVTGTLGVGNGGTGAATLTSNGVLIGNGTSPVTAISADATTTHILHGGSPPSFGAMVASDLPTSPTVSGTWDFGTGITLPTSGGTKTTLNYYEEYTLSTTFQGNNGGTISPTTYNIPIVRVGKLVTMRMSRINDAGTGGTSTAVTNNNAIPSRLRPGDNVLFAAPGIVVGGSTTTGGILQITSLGVINILRDINSTAWVNQGSNGIFETSVSWTTN